MFSDVIKEVVEEISTMSMWIGFLGVSCISVYNLAKRNFTNLIAEILVGSGICVLVGNPAFIMSISEYFVAFFKELVAM